MALNSRIKAFGILPEKPYPKVINDLQHNVYYHLRSTCFQMPRNHHLRNMRIKNALQFI